MYRRCTRGGEEQYAVRHGVACKLVNDKFCPIVPVSDKELVDAILGELHASALGGHLSFRKMLDLCRTRFYWPNMRAMVDRFCRHC